ncbi:hypothetical protein OG288_36945 [Streptomyces tauricus]|uniref:Uncharacterized protein n=1 Tax=Streptomyces tauricus TaxID=68274 RepID=A0ABZ1JTA1_9ACTN|nr:hypothetical protein [Streptomyces tauricus]
MLAALTSIGGLLGLIVSLIFLAFQTRAMSRQVSSSNNLAGTQILDQTLGGLREVHFKMLEYPGMRSYFYEASPLPALGTDRDRVLTFAELMADVLDTGLQAIERTPESDNQEWVSYCRFVMSHSPALRDMVTSHSDWWPRLAAL